MHRLLLLICALVKCSESQINPIGYNPDVSTRPTWPPNYNQNNNPNYNQNNNPNYNQNNNPNYNPNDNNYDPLTSNNFDPNQNRNYDPNNPDFSNANPFNNPTFTNNLNPNVQNVVQNNNNNNNNNPFNRDRDRDDDRNRQNSMNPYDSTNAIIKEATYFVVASRMVRPGQIFKVAVTVFKTIHPLAVRCSIQRNRVEMSADTQNVKEGIPETLIMRVPSTSVAGNYRLRVEGIYDGMIGGIAFVNETELTFSQRSMTIFIQTDKPIYMQGQTVKFRTIPINTELRAFDSTLDVYILDPKRNIMRRWLSRQSNLGTVSLNYQLSDQPVFGQWIIQSIAQGQVEEATFMVEEYYQTRYEVNVTMPAFFFNNEPYLHGRVMANYTNGGPVRGNLTIKATIRPLGLHRNNAQPYERYFNFNELIPSWFHMENWNARTVPHLKFFYGVYDFKFPMSDLEVVNSPEGMEIVITATVGDRFLNDVISGYSTARIYNNTIKAFFLGGSPQVFKPAMPIDCYVTVTYHDNSPLSDERLKTSRVELTPTLISRSGQRNFGQRALNMSNVRAGVWHFKFDIRNELGISGIGGSQQKLSEVINDVTGLKLSAIYRDAYGYPTTAEVNMLAHYSLSKKYLKVYTSTEHAKVGEYIILHVQTNFHLDSFEYVVMSKGIILISSQETMTSTIRTFAVPLSAEMAPVATAVVYHVGHHGDVIADSLTFPVNGISRNNFTVFINDRKARTGERVEVAIYGEPGAYVGLSGIDRAFYSMQAGNELTYAQVITKMSRFDEQTNGTHAHRYISHAGDPDEIVYFPSSTYGIDANRTFEYAGLVVFTDVIVPRRPDQCNISMGLLECLDGRCYRAEKKCDGMRDCEDGTDESECKWDNRADLAYFRKNRFSRIQRQYEHVWLWKDVNIGPHGRYIFEIEVPKRPAHWMISAFSMSPRMGFGMLQKSLEFVGELPFYINVEMPNTCRQGEQVGIRVTVFNYQRSDIEATVVLGDSSDYKFVHVEMNGIVRSYNPRTSFGEHQFFIFIPAQDASIVHIPIVPTRLGDMEVTIHASTLIGKDSVTRKLHVEADGLPQYRHQSILLDLRNRAYVFQYLHVNITETPIIPYDENRYYIFGSNKAYVSVVGDVVGPIFPTMPVNATSLLHLPQDSAEQTLFSFAANMYTTLFMRLINQRNRTLERQSFYHMNIGYQRALSFMNPDGSFSLFRSDWNHSSPSVWLTAFCARVFQEASFYEWENFIYIDPQVIAKSVSYILKHQTESGAFYDVTWLADRKMNRTGLDRDKQHRFRNISLTAHVLITLEVVKDLTGGLGAQVANAQKRAIHWLEWNLNNIENNGEPYEVSIVAYALLLSKSAIAETAFGILAKHARNEGGLMYWGKDRVPQPPFKIENQKPFSLPRLPYIYDSANIEATSYALLTYVARQELMIDPIVKWLNSQRLTDGGWASTQDSIVAMKALMEYTIRSRLRDVSSLTITIEATALKGKTKTLHVTNKNIARLQRIEIPEAWGTVKVQAKGAGYAILQMSVQYNVDIPKFQTQPPVRAFSLKTRANFHGRNQSHITYLSCQKWILKEESERSGMAVLDITIPTGYIIQQQTLDAYIRSRQVYNLHRARFHDRKVLFYFNYLDHKETCINFTIERWLPVANMSRYLPIRIYDYYAPERFNETIFDSLPTYLLNICEVCGSSQCPYCPIYNVASAMVPAFVMFLPVLLVLRHWLFQTSGSLFLAVT